jgi:ZIP family zinc transporter
MALTAWGAGLTAFIGGVFARIEGTADTAAKRELVHGIVAFGGGILLAAIAFVLIPEGAKELSPFMLALTFCVGGILFCWLDEFINTRGDSKAQLIAMLMDFVPEAISLGAVFSRHYHLGILLALFIGAQNLPEGFNSFKEITASNGKRGSALLALGAISFLGPVAALGGHFFLQDHMKLTAGIMSFAAGGILYLIFQDIAPESKMRRRWTPALGAVFGFMVGMIGNQLIG